MNSAEKSRRWRQAHPERPLWYDARRRARSRGVPFTLTDEDVQALLTDGWVCAFCETPVGSYSEQVRPLSATLDRLIPDLGYTKSNTVICCHGCNVLKGEHTPASLREWADKIEAIIHRKNP